MAHRSGDRTGIRAITTTRELFTDGWGTLTGSSGAWTDFSGSATVYSENITAGTVICDFDVDLAGTAAACPDCEFSFAMDATLTRDASSADCDYEPHLSFIDTADVYDSYLEYIAEYTTPTYSYTYTNPRTGKEYTYTWGGDLVPAELRSTYTRYYVYYGYPYAWEGSYTIGGGGGDDDEDTGGGWDTGGGSSGAGTFEFVDDLLTWELEVTESTTEVDETYLDADCGYDYSRSRAAIPGAVTETEDVECTEAYSLDVWTVAAESGQTLTASVDTVDRATAFMPLVWLNAPDGCTVLVAAENFACSFGRGECSSFEHVVDADGDWQIVVAAYECERDFGEYEISVDVK